MIKPVAGDVLLMMSTDELSKLIAWCGDSQYSHSALMVTDDVLMESISSGITRTQLSDFKKPEFKIKFLDVFRSLDCVGNTFNDAQKQAVQDSAFYLEGLPFEFGKLLQIGIFCAIRQKIPLHPVGRKILRYAFDRILENNERAMTCSQFVYTALMRADTDVDPNVSPRIIYSGPSGIPMPHDIDWKALVKEISHMLGGNKKTGAAEQLLVNSLQDGIPVDLAELQQTARVVRYALGLGVSDIASIKPGEVIEKPNPKLITPGDLLATPDHIALGRWFSRS